MISGTFVERLLGSLLRALRIAGVVLESEAGYWDSGIGQRHLGGVLHRLGRDAGIARSRQRQDQSHLDLSGAGHDRLLRRARVVN